jgi:CRP/FNR family transcriptional regulator
MGKMNTTIKETVKLFFDAYPSRQFSKGEIVLRPEDELKDIIYLEDGQIIAYDISVGGNDIVVNAFKPGSFFPLSQAINNTPNKYFYEAVNPVTARIAPSKDVVAFLKKNPDVTFDLLSRVYRGTDGLLRRTAHLMGGSAKSRLIFELLNASARFGVPGNDASTFIPLTESDLAKRSGLSRETVSRTIRTLKTAGLVQLQARGVVILNHADLEATLGSEL